jgi:hypothetical protein
MDFQDATNVWAGATGNGQIWMGNWPLSRKGDLCESPYVLCAFHCLTFSQDNSTILPYLQALSSFRDDIRSIAKNKSPDMTRELLILCDKLRGDVLPPLGIQLSDRAGP